MKRTTRWELLALVFISLTACTKSNHPDPAVFAGSWKLISSTGSFNNDIVFKRNDTTVRQTEVQTYNSTSASGIQTFSSNSTSSDGLAVHALITQSTQQFYNGVLNQDTTTNYPYDQTTVNVQSNFELIGSDSIHFEGPGIPLIAGLSPIGGGNGALFSIVGNTLTFTTHIYTVDSSEATVQHHYQTTVTTFMRQ